jgi:(E)-4-hydroxy-3-methylbut-2-enyl-diphosphate synthase
MERRNTVKVKVGNIAIGGDAPITVQSMLNIPSTDIEGSVRQATALEQAGCEIIRAAVPDRGSVKLIEALKKEVSVPIVADIHFDYKIALDCVAAGVDKIRINPGNIGDESRVKAVADACRLHNIPIRIGVNTGSLEKSILAKYGHPCPEALCDSALYHASLLEKYDFDQIVLSLKASTVDMMVQSYELAAQRCNYPLHLGVTEAGTARMGLIKSAAGIGSLLLHGIGDHRAFATVYAAMCAREKLKCYVVNGSKNGEAHTWNIVSVDGVYYHVDLLRNISSGEFKMMFDDEMDGYIWDYDSYPPCTRPKSR